MSLPSAYRQLPLVLPAPPDRPGPLAATRAALAAADHAADRPGRQRATAVLAAHLAGVAQGRGRAPVPKPGHRPSETAHAQA